VHDGLKRWGFVIDPGPGRLGTATFRISTLGDVTRYDIGRLMAAIETVFKR
jgi:aspartate aminotransferase-like enzyme